MTKESRHFKKSSEDLFQNILLVIIILLFLSYFITSCNSSNDPSDHSESIDTAATSSDTANRTSEKNLNTNLDILYLTEEEFRSFPSVEDKRKMVFQFHVTDTGRGDFTLLAWASKKHKFGEKTLPLHNHLRKSDLDIANTEVIFGHQKLPKPSIKKILDNLDTTPNNEFIVFYPELDRQNHHIRYEIYIFKSLDEVRTRPFKFTGKIVDTNPSPPATEDPDSIE